MCLVTWLPPNWIQELSMDCQVRVNPSWSSLVLFKNNHMTMCRKICFCFIYVLLFFSSKLLLHYSQVKRHSNHCPSNLQELNAIFISKCQYWVPRTFQRTSPNSQNVEWIHVCQELRVLSLNITVKSLECPPHRISEANYYLETNRWWVTSKNL